MDTLARNSAVKNPVAKSNSPLSRTKRDKGGGALWTCVKLTIVGTILTGSIWCQENSRVERKDQTGISEVVRMRSCRSQHSRVGGSVTDRHTGGIRGYFGSRNQRATALSCRAAGGVENRQGERQRHRVGSREKISGD